MTTEIPLPSPCPRCGRRVQLDLAEAAVLAMRVEMDVGRAPNAVTYRTRLALRLLALTLPCLAGTCSKDAVV